MSAPQKVVSDHALLRWLERAHGIDMEVFRRELEGIVADAAQAGAATLKADDMVYCFKNGSLVTVMTKDQYKTTRWL